MYILEVEKDATKNIGKTYGLVNIHLLFLCKWMYLTMIFQCLVRPAEPDQWADEKQPDDSESQSVMLDFECDFISRQKPHLETLSPVFWPTKDTVLLVFSFKAHWVCSVTMETDDRDDSRSISMRCWWWWRGMGCHGTSVSAVWRGES